MLLFLYSVSVNENFQPAVDHIGKTSKPRSSYALWTWVGDVLKCLFLTKIFLKWELPEVPKMKQILETIQLSHFV